MPARTPDDSMKWAWGKLQMVMWVPAIYLRHIEDALTGKRDLNKLYL